MRNLIENIIPIQREHRFQISTPSPRLFPFWSSASFQLASSRPVLTHSQRKWNWRREPVIRQAISCDICGAEMLNTNHWFVVCEQGTELRISACDTRNRLRASAKHLCGQKCLHRLLDDFMARTRTGSEEVSAPKALSQRMDTSLTSTVALRATPHPVIGSCVAEFESSARLLHSPAPAAAKQAAQTHRLHADAWKRERERQQQAANCRSIA
jgi:hypothetical protein